MPSINRSLNVIGRCGALFRARRLPDTGVDPYNYFYLIHICRHPGLSQDALARALYVNKSSVTRHLSRLESAGLLTRTPSLEDRRVLLVDPTEKALEMLPFLREIGGDWLRALTDGFTEEETARFEALLCRAMENATRATGEVEQCV